MAKLKRFTKIDKHLKLKKDVQEGITYHNNDVLFKFFSENYKNKSFNVYGLNLPKIKEVLPTNLPVLLNEKHMDNLFLLEDDSMLIVEYESRPRRKDLIKYGHYGFRVYERYYKGKERKVHLVVIYTGEVESAPNHIDMGFMQLSFTQVFLSKFDGNKMYDEIRFKIENNMRLSEEDAMRLVILPLTGKKINKEDLIEKSITLAKEIKDEKTQNFVLTGIIALTAKFITDNTSKKIREWMKMTKVEKLYREEFEEEFKEKLKEKDEEINKLKEEKIEAVNKITKEKDEEKIEAINKTAKETEQKRNKEIATNMLRKGMEIIDIMELSGLQKAEILDLRKALAL